MNPAITPSAVQLLALVKSSLWQRPVDEGAFSNGSVDWPEIGQLALLHTVGVLASEGAFTLPEDLQPPKEWRLKALAFIEANRRTHILVDKCVAEAVTKLRDDGIAAVLLKGQAYATVYPRSELRQCGDIDLYVGENGYYDAYCTAKSFGWKSDETFNPAAKHYGCELRGVRVELHRKAAELPAASIDRLFQKWSPAQIFLSERTVSIANLEIPVPTPAFDIVFVFLHLFNHFINGGIGLRHICDWTMLLHAYAKDINPGILKQKLKELRLMRAWKSFAPITVLYLGLPESECPFYSKRYEKRSAKILSTIMNEGNFGRAKPSRSARPEGYFASKLYSLRLISTNHINKIWIDPHAVIRSFIRCIHIGTTRILKDMTKGEVR